MLYGFGAFCRAWLAMERNDLFCGRIGAQEGALAWWWPAESSTLSLRTQVASR